MKLVRTLRGLGLVAAMSSLLVAGVRTAASAHATSQKIVDGCCIFYGQVWVSADHHTITVCDQRADGIGVYAEYYQSNGVYGTVSDTDGSGGSCGQIVSGYAITIYHGVSRDGHSTNGWVSA